VASIHHIGWTGPQTTACSVLSTFETTTFTVGSIDSTVAALLIYRPGSAVVTDAFFTELTTYKCQILVAGDSNIHTERAGDADAGRLHEILQSFDCIQQVLLTPTRRSGGTLDLIVTKSEQVLADMTVDPADISSDHSVISWCFLLLLRGERLVQSEQGQFPCCTAWVRAMSNWAPCNHGWILLWALRQCSVKVSRPAIASQESDTTSSATSAMDGWWMSPAAQEVADARAMLPAIKAIGRSSSLGRAWDTATPDVSKEREYWSSQLCRISVSGPILWNSLLWHRLSSVRFWKLCCSAEHMEHHHSTSATI